jgi:alpha-galactosidase
MSELYWRIELENGAVFSGTAEAGGEVRVVCPLPEGTLRSVTARVGLDWQKGDRLFLNGFQSWTYSPECTENDKLRGLKHLPSAGVRHFGLDRYGDNYFVEYPGKKGLFHGESWGYVRRGEEYLLAASLDERPGYTILRTDLNRGELTFERDCAGMRCGGDFHAFDLFCAEGTEQEVFDGWFNEMGVRPLTGKKLFGYSSWYNRYQDINDATITDDLIGAKALLKEGDLFQIDDGWEAFVGDWLETDPKKFPNGLKASADAIHEAGFLAGLWLAPFVAQKGSKLVAEHPDWLLMHDGKPWSDGSNWGGFWSLDIDNPEVAAYVRKVLDRVLHEWGFDLVKLDFLYGAAPFGTETESRAARMIRAIDLLRDACKGKMILGCGVPLWPAFGKVEYCRVGCDVGLDWNDTKLMQITHRERVSTKQSIEDTVFRRQLTRRAFMGDPDVFFLREQNCKLTDEEKEKLFTANALLGGFLLTSDALNTYTDEQKARFAHVRELFENAADVTVDADDGITVRYTLDGKAQAIRIL